MAFPRPHRPGFALPAITPPSHYVQGLLRRRAAAPDRVKRWALISVFRPTLASQVPDFRAAGSLSGRADTVLRVALEKMGIEFLNHGSPGVRLRNGGARGDAAASIKIENLNAENDE
jgi:hypothetical protein